MIRSFAVLAALAFAAPAAAAVSPVPKDCGETPSGRHAIHVDANSDCDFGAATAKALKAYDEQGPGFVPAVEKDFVLKVAYKGHKVKMDCRALVRAHGEFDFYCNNLNRFRGFRVVRFDNLTLPRR
ncbi:MAG: hypothetical protein ACJ762_17695 [Solirubrobacteraceae bacterium]